MAGPCSKDGRRPSLEAMFIWLVAQDMTLWRPEKEVEGHCEEGSEGCWAG